MPVDRRPGRAAPRAVALAVLALAGASASAQETARRALSVTPTFSATQTWTDNRTLSATNKESDFVTQLSPGVRVQSNSGAVTGVLDYQLTGVVHQRMSELNQTQNSFNANLLVQPPASGFSLATRASLTRQTLSAFGVQPADPLLETRNTTDVASAGLAPRLVGTLGGLVDYTVQVSRDLTRAKNSDAGDASSTSAQFGLSGRSGRLGWGLNADRQRVAYRRQPSTTDDRAYASLLWFPDGDLRLVVRGGRDRSDALGDGSQGRASYGGGLSWTPSPRTTFSFDADRRYYGNSHSLSFDYRTERSLWRLADSRSASSTSGSIKSGSLELARSYLQVIFPGQTITDDMARGYLILMGRNPNEDLLLATRALTRQTEAAFFYSGLRTTLGLSAFRTQADSLRSDSLFGDYQTPSARVYGLTATASHRLTPRDSLSLIGTWQHTADAGTIQGNTLKSINLLWSTQPMRRMTVSFGGRHVIFDGLESYDETGVSATLSLQF